MTTPSAFNKIQKLLWFGHKKGAITGIIPTENTAVIDPNHVMIVRAVRDESAPINTELNDRTIHNLAHDPGFNPESRVILSLDYLKAVISTLDGTYAKLYFANDRPIKIVGCCDDVKITALIAPIVDPDVMNDDVDLGPQPVPQAVPTGVTN